MVWTVKAIVRPSGESCGSLMRATFMSASASKGSFCALRIEQKRRHSREKRHIYSRLYRIQLLAGPDAHYLGACGFRAFSPPSMKAFSRVNCCVRTESTGAAQVFMPFGV